MENTIRKLKLQHMNCTPEVGQSCLNVNYLIYRRRRPTVQYSLSLLAVLEVTSAYFINQLPYQAGLFVMFGTVLAPPGAKIEHGLR